VRSLGDSLRLLCACIRSLPEPKLALTEDCQLTNLWAMRLFHLGNMLDNVRDSTFTMFAPSKEAFRQLAHQTNGHYLDRSSHDALLDLVASHILPGVITVDHIPAHGLKVHTPSAVTLSMCLRSHMAAHARGVRPHPQ
jgi:hypothetical protein